MSTNNAELSPRKRALKRKQALETVRSNYIEDWQDISKVIAVFRGRYSTSDTNKNLARSRLKGLHDPTGLRAHLVLEAGLMSGNTSPARPWFRLKTPDEKLNDYHSVKEWLHECTEIVRKVFNRSNTYRALRALYSELGAFGTAVDIVERNFGNVIHHSWLTAGEYCLATDEYGRVNTIMREFAMTVEQCVGAFGMQNVSQSVKQRYERFDYNSFVDVLHVIEPRRINERDPKLSRFANHKPWKSCYYESKGNEDKALRESGYDRFPGIAARWTITSPTDPYGFGPGSVALPHVKQLQQQSLRKAQAVDYQTKPPVQMPTSMQHRPHNMLPAGITFTDDTSKGIRTAFETRLDLSHLREDIADVRAQIKEAFYEDLFLMLANADIRSGTTAHEIAMRHEEKLLMLGPMLENLYGDALTPLVEGAFERCLEAGILPPPPAEMNNQELSVEFVSTLAQAQRAVGVQSIDRVVGVIASLSAIRPEAADKIDVDKAVDAYADAFGADPSIIVANERVALIRENRAKEAAAAQQLDALPKIASAAKAMGDIPQQGQPEMYGTNTPSLTGYGGTGL